MTYIHFLLINIYDLVIWGKACIHISEVKFSTVLITLMQNLKKYNVLYKLELFFPKNFAFHFPMTIVKACPFSKDIE
jgi:hypothetical protein